MSQTTLPGIRLDEVVNVATVIHRSPFRYPGGKTWLVPRIRQWLKSLSSQPRELAEPFAGGGIVALSALFEGLAQKIILIEKDEDVAAVWNVIVGGDGSRLARDIVDFDLTESNVRRYLNQPVRTSYQRAFATILRNRVQRGGIIAPGASFLNKGENNKGIRSRWYPATLRDRIENIVQIRKQIAFIEGDGIEFIRYNAHRPDTAFFIDPPYTVAGRRLYKHSEIDHRELFRVAKDIQGDFLMTYDDSDEIRELAKESKFEVGLVAMKNTHHAVMKELVIGKNLRWLKSTSVAA